MNTQDVDAVAARVLELLTEQVFSVAPTIRQGNAGQVIGATYNKVGDVQARLQKIVDVYLVPLSVLVVQIDSALTTVSGQLAELAEGISALHASVRSMNRGDGNLEEGVNELLEQAITLRAILETLTLRVVPPA